MAAKSASTSPEGFAAIPVIIRSITRRFSERKVRSLFWIGADGTVQMGMAVTRVVTHHIELWNEFPVIGSA
jgi:hypothetical protein